MPTNLLDRIRARMCLSHRDVAHAPIVSVPNVVPQTGNLLDRIKASMHVNAAQGTLISPTVAAVNLAANAASQPTVLPSVRPEL